MSTLTSQKMAANKELDALYQEYFEMLFSPTL